MIISINQVYFCDSLFSVSVGGVYFVFCWHH